MSNIAELVLSPHLIIFNGETYEDEHRESIRLGLGSSVDKQIAKNISKDRTNIGGVFHLCCGEMAYKVLSYDFDPKHEDITIKLRKNEGVFTADDEETIEEVIDDGPDTWMESDITILTGEELYSLTKNPLHKTWSIELGFSLIELIYKDEISDEDSEEEINEPEITSD